MSGRESLAQQARHANVGKRVYRTVYVHREALPALPASSRAAVAEAEGLAGDVAALCNVIKFDDGEYPKRVSLLAYEPFDEVAFPALLESVTVDLVARGVHRRNLRASLNPPILHRKELLLPVDHPERDRFSALTAALERLGVPFNAPGIGFRRQWEQCLADRGVRVTGHEVVQEARQRPSDSSPSLQSVARHRTAIVRGQLSSPMQALGRHGLLSTDRTTLDYGCGQGDDVRALTAAGIAAAGWDPHYSPETPIEPADVVNLGFVLNVIEEPRERLETLRRAFSFARVCLSVAVMIDGKGDTTLRPYRDGFLTQRDTFQKYYRQEEIKQFIEDVLKTEAIAVGPGIFFVFTDKIAEQEFLVDRQRRRFSTLDSLGISAPPLRDKGLRAAERLRPILEPFWRRMLDLGRAPGEADVDPELSKSIRAQVGSLRRGETLCRRLFDEASLKAAATERHNDLLVYFALNLFNRRQPYRLLPEGLQRDVKVFFGNLAATQEAGHRLLFSIGRRDVIAECCQEAVGRGIGHLRTGDSLHLHAALVERLPPALRCYVGCAGKLYGDIENADLVKIHIRSGKLTLLRYDNFDGSPVPALQERVKIDMRLQRTDLFDHANRSPQLLLMKSRYMASDQQGYAEQRAFDEKLAALSLFDLDGFGPTSEEFAAALTSAGVRMVGFDLRSIRRIKSPGRKKQ